MTGDICPVGHYCPLGSTTYTPCSVGEFMNHTGADACYICPAGYFCVDGSQAELCPQGSYCPEGTGSNSQQCPEGTFGASPGLTNETECYPCLGGYYCDSPGLTAATTQCLGGYYCVSGQFNLDQIRSTSLSLCFCDHHHHSSSIPTPISFSV